MLKWIFAGFLVSMMGLLLYLFIHLGFYKSPQIEGAAAEEFWMLYKTHRGAYHLISPELTKIEATALKASIPCLDTFGLFLDDPKSMAEDRLRSEVGCIIGQEVSSPPEGLSVKKWAPGEVLHLSFDGSPAISPFKVYPMAEAWFAQKRKKMPQEVLEIYSMSSRGDLKTHYYFPLQGTSNNDE